MSESQDAVPAAQSQPAGQTNNQVNDPSVSSGGKSEDSSAEAHSNIPENLKGKSEADLVKMYGELERKLGEQSNSVSEAKKIRENQEILARAVQSLSESDPDTIKKLEEAVAKVIGVQTQDTTVQDKKGKEPVEIKPDPAVNELRQVAVNKTFDDFVNKHGLNKVGADEKKQILEKTAQELMDLYDPGGSKEWQQVLKEIPLQQLNSLLDKAYFLSTIGTSESRGGQEFGSIGSIPSSTQQSDDIDVFLTSDEKKLAQALGVSEEKWSARKKEKLESKKK